MSGFSIGFADHKRFTHGTAEELEHLETFLSEVSERCGLNHKTGGASASEIGFASGYYGAKASQIYLETNGDMNNSRLTHAMHMNEFVGMLAETYPQIDQNNAQFRKAYEDGERFVTAPGSFVQPQVDDAAAAAAAPAVRPAAPRFR